MFSCPNSLNSLQQSSALLFPSSGSAQVTCSATAAAAAAGVISAAGIGTIITNTKLSTITTANTAALLLPVLASFLLCPGSIDKVDGIITNISLIQTWRWFFALTDFEAVFLGMILLQICGLQYLGILPFNINQYLYGMPSGKKRRRKRSSRRRRSVDEVLIEYERNGQFLELDQPNLIEKMLATLHQMDRRKCTLRTICELQNWNLRKKKTIAAASTSNGTKEMEMELPKSLQLTLHVFSMNHRKRSVVEDTRHESNSSSYNTTITRLYEEAAELGRAAAAEESEAALDQDSILVAENMMTMPPAATANTSTAMNKCTQFYGECDLTLDEILGYVHDMNFDDIFF